ncbi:hypothetical protein BKI52_38090 [marine bacterium AO1-C]|nr:hypothetical protein BKI52_38090 [marine bacterium AO1-C]
MIKRVMSVFLLVGLFFSSALAQQKLLPKGKWFNRRNPTGTVVEITQLQFMKDSRLVFTPVMTYDEKEKTLPVTVTIHKMILNKNTGKLLLKFTEKGKEDFILYLYRRLNNDELQIYIPGWFKAKDESEALQSFKKIEEYQKIADQDLEKYRKSPVKRSSMYDSGIIWRSEKLYQRLNKLPASPEMNKKQVMATYLRVLDLCKQKKNQIFLNDPSSSIEGVQYLMEIAFIEKGYNPFTFSKNFVKSLQKFKGDKDIEDLQKKIVDFAMKGN